MPPTTRSYADIYPDEALRILLDNTREGFHALVYHAGRNGDLAFLEKALPLVEPSFLRIETGLFATHKGLAFTAASGERITLTTETLFGSFLRGLRGRAFDERSETYLDALLSKAVSGNAKITPSDVYGDALSWLMNVGADNQTLRHLVELGPTTFGQPSPMPIVAAKQDVYANTLAMAIITGNEESFAALLSRELTDKPATEKLQNWQDFKVIKTSPYGHSKEEYTTLDTILFFAEPERVENFLKLYHEHEPITTAELDGALRTYLERAKYDEEKVIEYEGHWSRTLNNVGWSEQTINAALSLRDRTARLPDELLISSMSRACYPILEFAIEVGHDNFPSVRRTKNPYAPINCTKLVARSNASTERISKSLDAIIAGGAAIDQYSDDTTALIEAAKNGELELAGVLLQHGADPTATDSRNWKPASSFKDKGKRAQFEKMINSLKAKKSVDTVLQAISGGKP